MTAALDCKGLVVLLEHFDYVDDLLCADGEYQAGWRELSAALVPIFRLGVAEGFHTRIDDFHLGVFGFEGLTRICGNEWR